MAKMPFYKDEFAEYLEYDQKAKLGVTNPQLDPMFVEYNGLVAKRGSRMTIDGPQQTVSYVDYDGRLAFTDYGTAVVPGEQLTRENVAQMLDHAVAKWGDKGIALTGSATFQKLVFEIAYERKLELQDPRFNAYAEHMERDKMALASISKRAERTRDDDDGREHGGDRGFDGDL